MSFSDDISIINPEFSVPFTFDLVNGSAVEVEQGDPSEIQQRIWAALSYAPGQFIANPDYGIEDQAFRKGGADLELIQAIITRWIPEAQVVIEADPNWFATAVETITIQRDNPNA